MARLQIFSGDSAEMTSGLTWKHSPHPSKYDFVCPSLVVLMVSPPSVVRYPLTTQHKDFSGPKVTILGPKVELGSWYEEIALVLAHELAHVDGFWDGSPRLTELEDERRAESRAVEVLGLVRKSLPKVDDSLLLRRAA